MKYDYLIVGAGFAGSVLAERIASQLDKKVLIVEKRNHIAGHAYDQYDQYGILVHKYGPHIFHTDNKHVFDYLSRFTKWRRYEHRVLAKLYNKYYPFPINRTTINQLYKKNLSTAKEIEDFFRSVKKRITSINNSEEKIVSQIGEDLFVKFFKHYTKKQWGVEAKDLDPEVLGRIPIRTDTDDRYFVDKYQFMPVDGYIKLFEKMLQHKNIEVVLNTDYKKIIDNLQFDKMIYTGEIDYFFDYIFGRLTYRSIKFEFKHFHKEYYLPAAQVNYVDESEEFTRATEYKRITNIKSDGTTVSFEYPDNGSDPYYPVPTDFNAELCKKYKHYADKLKTVIFCGRLAEYKYYNMDQVVAKALKVFDEKISV